LGRALATLTWKRIGSAYGVPRVHRAECRLLRVKTRAGM
jgi:hypothetical protein